MASPAIWVIVPLVIAVLSWHTLALEPSPGADISWQAALHMALHYRITFGNHLIFTYGPLGFLSVPTLWYSGTGIIAFLYVVLMRVALAAAVFAGRETHLRGDRGCGRGAARSRRQWCAVPDGAFPARDGAVPGVHRMGRRPSLQS